MRLAVVIPARNECRNIAGVVESARAALAKLDGSSEIIVVDDASDDGTSELLGWLGRQAGAPLRVIRRERSSGYGAAVATGLRAANAELVFFTDGDGQFRFTELAMFVAAAADADLVIGYRVRRDDPPHRAWLAWGWRWLTRLFLGVRARDVNCAYKLFRAEALQRLQFRAQGAAFNADLLAQAARQRLRVRELPVAHYPRRHGSSSGDSPRVIWRALAELARLRCQTGPA